MNDQKWNESLRDRLKAIVSRYVRQGSVIDASDIVNSAIVTAYRKRDQFRGKTDAEFHAWLRTIVLNKYHTRSRSERAERRGGGKTVALGADQRLDAPSRENRPTNSPATTKWSRYWGNCWSTWARSTRSFCISRTTASFRTRRSR